VGPLVVSVVATGFVLGALATVWAVAKVVEIENKLQVNK
jgi:hypothetical protein